MFLPKKNASGEKVSSLLKSLTTNNPYQVVVLSVIDASHIPIGINFFEKSLNKFLHSTNKKKEKEKRWRKKIKRREKKINLKKKNYSPFFFWVN